MPTNTDLVHMLVSQGVLKTPTIIDAFTGIDRKDFVPKELAPYAYENMPLPINHGQTISQPYIVAFMLELLQPTKGNRILDIGSGSGWQTALLAHMTGSTGHVIALEIIPELCTQSRKNLSKYPFFEQGILEMHCQSGYAGYLQAAPFDRIIAAASGSDIPTAWQEQLNINGRIVAPVGNSIVLITRTGDQSWEEKEFFGFAFVPLVE